MNRISPKSLMHSKWTKVSIKNQEKHFLITSVKFDEQKNVVECVIEAVFNNKEYQIQWRDLKDCQQWKQGWL